MSLNLTRPDQSQSNRDEGLLVTSCTYFLAPFATKLATAPGYDPSAASGPATATSTHVVTAGIIAIVSGLAML
ncbi:hypothetical protein FSPOR_8919 [Fusarium sporotrichioides]|uniref:Uncharacterized protein n=1 Tax=Fusarium sporotrichioides TaxID=5514 RepID=A0A395RS33_FUSSP|nr:hypothetical protein FSPOR_8919 [Fusarium sporotrichioides]